MNKYDRRLGLIMMLAVNLHTSFLIPILQPIFRLTCLGLLGIAPVAQAASNPTVPHSAVPNPIDVLPADASGIILINNNPTSWEGLTKFGLFPPDFSTPGALFEPLAPGLNFNLDVEPWLGESFGVGYMPDGKMVLIAPVKDPALATVFLDRLAEQQAEPATITTHNGVTIQSWIPKKEASPEKITSFFKQPGFAIAQLPSGFIVRAETVETVQQLIDSANQPRLSSTPEVQQMQQDPRYTKALFAGFGDYGKIISSLQAQQLNQIKTAPKLPAEIEALQPTPESLAAIAKLYGGVSGFVWAEPTGIRMQTSMNLNLPVTLSLPAVAPKHEIFQQLPGVTYAVSSSQNLAAFLQLFNLGLDSDPKIKKQFDPLRQLSQKIIGIDDRDLTWMDGEYAIFAFPSKQGFLANNFKVDLGLGFIAQTSDRAKAEATLGKVTQRLQENLGKTIKIENRTIAKVPVVSLEMSAPAVKGTAKKSAAQKLNESQNKSQPQSFFSYSWVKPDTVVILNGVDSTMIPKPWQILADSANFKEAIAPLPKDNQDYFYVNGSASTSFIFNDIAPMILGKEFATSAVVEPFKTAFGSVRSLAGTIQYQPNTIVSEGFMHLGEIKRAPLTAQDWIDAGEQRLAELNADWAIANFSRAIQQSPENPQAYFGRGKARKELTDHKGAIADFNQVLKLNPNPNLTSETYDQRGKAYFSDKDYESAIADLSRAIERGLDLPVNYLMRSNASIETGDYPGAIADATRAIEMEDIYTGYSNRCYAKARLGDFQSAKSDCEQISLSESKILQNWDFISRYCYVKTGLKDASGLEDCQQAIIEEPENPYHYENQGLAYALRKENQQAVKAFGRSIELFKHEKNQYGVKRVEKLLQTVK